MTETAGGAESVALQLLPSCTLSMADTRIEDSAGVGAFVGAFVGAVGRPTARRRTYWA